MNKPIKKYVMGEKEKQGQVEEKLRKLGIVPVCVSTIPGTILPYTEIIFKNEEDKNLYCEAYGE